MLWNSASTKTILWTTVGQFEHSLDHPNSRHWGPVSLVDFKRRQCQHVDLKISCLGSISQCRNSRVALSILRNGLVALSILASWGPMSTLYLRNREYPPYWNISGHAPVIEFFMSVLILAVGRPILVHNNPVADHARRSRVRYPLSPPNYMC